MVLRGAPVALLECSLIAFGRPESSRGPPKPVEPSESSHRRHPRSESGPGEGLAGPVGVVRGFLNQCRSLSRLVSAVWFPGPHPPIHHNQVQPDTNENHNHSRHTTKRKQTTASHHAGIHHARPQHTAPRQRHAAARTRTPARRAGHPHNPEGDTRSGSRPPGHS